MCADGERAATVGGLDRLLREDSAEPRKCSVVPAIPGSSHVEVPDFSDATFRCGCTLCVFFGVKNVPNL